MTGPLARRLQTLAALSGEDCAALDDQTSLSQVVASGEDIVAQGAPLNTCAVLVDGLACRHKVLPDGRRQILSFAIPGDILDLGGFFLRSLDHAVGTVVSSRVSYIGHGALSDLLEHRAQIALAMWRATLIDSEIARQWLINLGHAAARERIAHLFCELAQRLDAVGLGHENRYRLRLTQSALAGATGMSEVHVNRILQQLRRDGLIAFDGGILSILDVGALKRVGEFDPGYLRLDLNAQLKGRPGT